MGEHLPLGILSGVAIAALARQLSSRAPTMVRPGAAAALLIAPLSITSVLFVYRDVHRALDQNQTDSPRVPVYWPASDVRTLTWFRDHTAPGTVLLALPESALAAPGITGRPVFAGHWAETPDFEHRARQAVAFFGGEATPAARYRLLERNGIHYVFGGCLAEAAVASRRATRPGGIPLDREAFLRPVHTDGATTLFEVVPPSAP